MTRMKRRGASVPVTTATAASPTPSPTQAPARPGSGRRRPCFVSMATGGAGPAPNITRCGKHAARGTPPRPLLRAEPRGALARPRPRADLREPPEPARAHKTRLAGTRRALGAPGLAAVTALSLREEGPADNPSPLREPPLVQAAAALPRSRRLRPVQPRPAQPRPASGLPPAPAPGDPLGAAGGRGRAGAGGSAGGGASGPEGGQDGGAHGAVLLVGGLGATVSGPGQPGRAGTLPALRTSHGEVISVPHKIITHLRKETSPPQKYNADYDLSARQGADTLAFMSLLEEKLLPVLIHTFWVDTKNYVEVTRKWYAEAIPFPLNFFLPGRMQRQFMERLQLLCGEHSPENEEELEKELYQEARECLTLLSQRLGSQKFFFGDAPASLDAFVFGYLALLLQAKLPSGKLQAHLRGLQNLCAYCTHILSLYFPWDGADVPLARQTPVGPETEEEPYRRRNQILSVLAGLAAMVGYALLSGIVSIQRATPARAPSTQSLSIAEEDEDE
eukprot:XP_022277003.1 metaxin-1 isoform X1 [Canis lupus familiaris]